MLINCFRRFVFLDSLLRGDEDELESWLELPLDPASHLPPQSQTFRGLMRAPV